MRISHTFGRHSKLILSVIVILFVLFELVLYWGSYPYTKGVLVPSEGIPTSSILVVLFSCLVILVAFMNILRYKELIDAEKAIIFSLAALAEWRDPETGHHLKRTRDYAVVLAKELRKERKHRRIIDGVFLDDLYNSIPLHDIGKVGIRDNILLKKGKLTKEEYEEMKKHVWIGERVLQDIVDTYSDLKQSFFVVGKNVCAYHHEKYNGTGYPHNAKGEEIPLEARIFALCDAYDAIRSKRPYKEKLSHEEAVKLIEKDRGEHFDPDVVDAFLRCHKEFLRVSFNYRY